MAKSKNIILSGADLVKSKQADPYSMSTSSIMQPSNFLCDKDKDFNWVSGSMNFIESQGMIQLRRNLNWMKRNYNLVNSIIEKSDYIKSPETEYLELIDNLATDGAMELKFYPMIELIVNTLTNEFSKRSSNITFDEKDEESYNEMLDQKYQEVEQVLLQQLAIKQQAKMIQMGLSEESEEGQQMLAPQTLKTLPEIQQFYTKSYRSMYQEWATHNYQQDYERFHMDEQERAAFKESLIVDRALFEIKMFENDYVIRKLNPIQTFYKKSPNERWLSNGQWAGYLDLMVVPDVIDNYGWMMTEEQLASLNMLFPERSATYMIDGKSPDGYYDPTQSYEWNKTGPGLAMRQLMSIIGGDQIGTGGDIVNQLFSNTEDTLDSNFAQLVRISTIYWKTQRKMGSLTKIDEEGNLIQDIITEDYVVTDKPLYNTIVYKEKTKENLIFGEHIDWLWVNEVWGGIKIGPNLPIYGMGTNSSGFAPMYIGMTGGKPGRLPFQFKGEDNLYGCKLPIEGAVFSDYNSKSRSLVDKLKPWQIGFNMQNNMMADLAIDELGVVVTFDPNALPKHSMGEDWGPDNFPKAIASMRDYSILPLNSSIANTEVPVNPNHFQKLDLSQSERFISFMTRARYYKEEGLSAVGLNAQRMGQPIDVEQTATGVNQAIASSFSATEHYFTQFSDELMPRVYQMSTDMGQYYATKNPSLRIQYSTPDDMKQWFSINSNKLLGKVFEVRCKTKINTRNILQQIKQLLLTNNTSGANLFDLVRGIKSESISEIDSVMKGIEKREENQRQQQMQQEQQQHEQELQNQVQIEQLAQDREDFRLEQKNKTAVLVAEINSQGRSGGVEPNAVEDNAYLDNAKFVQSQQQHTDKMDLEKQKLISQTALQKQNLQVQKDKIAAENKRTSAQLAEKRIADHRKSKDSKKK